ncbi:MAG: protein kinase [Acidobacteria bacterium]|nr:protein kinase [Acidobacteriota bacterium]
MAVVAGTNINQYRIISCLGSGGMGEVYLAQDVRLGRKVALKLLYENVQQGDDWKRRFEQEARATSSLNHPNIITIYEVGQVDGSHFISTEFIDGQTLRQHLKLNMLGLREALDIAVQVATALATAHEAGIIHRDIKPENVMLRADGYVKVLDFGLAKFVEKRLLGLSTGSDPDAETQGFVNTNPGAVMGTVSYMSPEQARGSHVDARSDIFSLGILLYEMLTGRQPFEGESASEVIISILQKRPRPMARFSQDVPVEMERIVGKALSKNREERYQTVKDMLIDLKRLRRGLELEAETNDEPEQELSRQLLSSSNNSGGVVRASSGHHNSQTKELAIPATTVPSTTASNAEYIVKGIKQHKKVAFITVGVIVAALAAFYYYSVTRPIDSIAVLPFTAASSEPGAENLGDDITEQLIYSLSKLSLSLRVAPFNDVLRFRGQPAQEMGRQLNVRAVLSGRVTKSGDNLTISTELVDVKDNRLLWGERTVTKFSDITLGVQNIVASVSDKIGLKLSAEGAKRREAESLYMRGRNAWNKRTADAIQEASGYFSEALKLDPNYAPAHAGLADSYNMLATYGASAPTEAFPKAIKEAETALGLDNNLAEAHAALAYAKFRGEWNWRQAEDEFKEAIRLNPNYASAHQWYANYLAAMGRFPEAIEETSRTLELDKTSLIISSHFGLMYFFAGRFDDSIAACRKTIELDPNFYVARRYLGLAYAQKGMYKESLEQYEKALGLSKNSPLMKVERASVLALSGDVDKAQSELKELQEIAKGRYISAYHIATIYVALKDRDRAFEWLEKAFTERADYMVFLNVDPRFKSLRSDSRFTDLLRRMNLG